MAVNNGYCKVEDVQSLVLPMVISDTSTPSWTDTADLIEAHTAKIETAINNAGCFIINAALLKSITEKSVAVEVWHYGNHTTEDYPRVEYWEKTVTEFYADVEAGKYSPAVEPVTEEKKSNKISVIEITRV